MKVKWELGLTLVAHQVLFLGVYAWILRGLEPIPPAVWSFFIVSPLLPLVLWIWVNLIPNVLVWQDGSTMNKLGLANHLTLFRLGSMPALSYLFILANWYPELYPLVAFWAGLAFLTDLSDGFLSRCLHQISRFGKALDSTSDYLLLVALLVVLTGLQIFPGWLLALGLIRLVAQMVAITVLMWRRRGLILETTLLGKAAIFSLMACLFVHLVQFLMKVEADWMGSIIWVLDGITALVLILSMIDKAFYFVKTWRSLQTPRA